MKRIEVNPELVLQYAKLTKNEVLLHMAIKAIAEDGKVERNIAKMSQLLGKTKTRIRDAEWGLKHHRLLRIYRINGERWWYIYDRPVGENEPVSTQIDPILTLPAVRIDEPPKRRSILRKIRDALVGTRLDNFDIEP